MKAILILDIDEKIHNSNVTSISFENSETIFFMKEVKLKPLPNKIPHSEFCDPFDDNLEDEFEYWRIEGYNQCLKEILEGEEE